MNKQRNKIFIIVIGILLIANIVLLSVFLFGKPAKKPERKSPMTTYLKNEIGFSDEQMVRFDTIKSQHRRQVKLIFDEMKDRKEASFKMLGQSGFSDSAIISVAASSAMQQQTIEETMLRHLRDIHNICIPAQQKKFDTGFYKMMVRPARGPDDRGRDQ